MVNEADKYRDEDEKQRMRIQAKNGLESYVFHMQSTIEDEKVKDKIPDADKEKIKAKCTETLEWFDQNQVSLISILMSLNDVQ